MNRQEIRKAQITVGALKADIREIDAQFEAKDQEIRLINRENLEDFLNGTMPQSALECIDELVKEQQGLTGAYRIVQSELDDAQRRLDALKAGGIVVPQELQGTGTTMNRTGKLVRI